MASESETHRPAPVIPPDPETMGKDFAAEYWRERARAMRNQRARCGHDGWATASCLLMLVLVLAWSVLLIKWLFDVLDIVARALAGWL